MVSSLNPYFGRLRQDNVHLGAKTNQSDSFTGLHSLAAASVNLAAARVTPDPSRVACMAVLLGLIPLVWAHGAAMLSRRAVGTAVFAGMIVATCIGVFLIPMLYVVFQSCREAVKRYLARAA